MELKRNDPQSWIETIWLGLDLILDQLDDEKKDDICTAMAWIIEELNEHGGYSIDDQF